MPFDVNHETWEYIVCDFMHFPGCEAFADLFSEGNFLKGHSAEDVFAVENIKEIVHPKMKILSSFTHPQTVSDLLNIFSSAEYKRIYFEECV